MGGEGIGQINVRAFRDARGVAADRGFVIPEELRDGEEAALHLERGCWSWTAKVFGRIGEDSVSVVEGLAREKERRALRQHLVAMPFEAAKVVPALGPAGFEARYGADALEIGDVVQERDKPGDEHGQGCEPAWAGRVIPMFVLVRCDLHAGIITLLLEVWDARVPNCLYGSAQVTEIIQHALKNRCLDSDSFGGLSLSFRAERSGDPEPRGGWRRRFPLRPWVRGLRRKRLRPE